MDFVISFSDFNGIDNVVKAISEKAKKEVEKQFGFGVDTFNITKNNLPSFCASLTMKDLTYNII